MIPLSFYGDLAPGAPKKRPIFTAPSRTVPVEMPWQLGSFWGLEAAKIAGDRKINCRCCPNILAKKNGATQVSDW